MKNKYFQILEKIIKDKMGNDIKIYRFNYSQHSQSDYYNMVEIKTDFYYKINKDEYLRFLKDIFKFEEYTITLDMVNKYDISFKLEKNTLNYLDKLLIFQ